MSEGWPNWKNPFFGRNRETGKTKESYLTARLFELARETPCAACRKVVEKGDVTYEFKERRYVVTFFCHGRTQYRTMTREVVEFALEAGNPGALRELKQMAFQGEGERRISAVYRGPFVGVDRGRDEGSFTNAYLNEPKGGDDRTFERSFFCARCSKEVDSCQVERQDRLQAYLVVVRCHDEVESFALSDRDLEFTSGGVLRGARKVFTSDGATRASGPAGSRYAVAGTQTAPMIFFPMGTAVGFPSSNFFDPNFGEWDVRVTDGRGKTLMTGAKKKAKPKEPPRPDPKPNAPADVRRYESIDLGDGKAIEPSTAPPPKRMLDL